VGLDEHGEGVDARLDEALDNWRMDRLSILDRGVLRIAAVEILHFQDVPPKVSIQEAVRLAERYSGNDSPRFVNGVLDALFKRSAD
jgi:N utilization substance protein B